MGMTTETPVNLESASGKFDDDASESPRDLDRAGVSAPLVEESSAIGSSGI